MEAGVSSSSESCLSATAGYPAASGLVCSEVAPNDHVWAMKRDWTDEDFQDGAESNRARLQEFENILISRLHQSCARALGEETARAVQIAHDTNIINEPVGNVLAQALSPIVRGTSGPPEEVIGIVLNDPEVLGSALDMVGVYLKNYEVDKAAAVVETVLPVCRQRGGLWLLKAYNHLATVRMKQARAADALVALEEVERYATMNLKPEQMDEAWEFWETVYRNFGWILSNLGQDIEAIAYIQRAVDVKERVGKPPSWFDLWDLGRMQASIALKENKADRIKESQAVVTKALWLHKDAEPSDLVMRAKIWHSVGECSFTLGHLAEGDSGRENPNGKAVGTEATNHYRKALKCFKESHKLFSKTEGAHNPLTGGEAQAVSWTLLKLGWCNEAKPMLLDALESASKQQNGWGVGSFGGQPDAKTPALLNAMQTVDRILEAHRTTDDRAGLVKYFSAVERLCANACSRLQLAKDSGIDAAIYEKLVSSCSMIMMASGSDEGAVKSQQLIKKYLWDSPNTPQAAICSDMLKALPSTEDGQQNASDPRIAVLMQALAQARQT